MTTKYFEDGDTLVIRFSENEIAKEMSLDWHTHVSFDEKGFPIEIVLVDAYKRHRILFDTCRNTYNLKMRRKRGTRPVSITARENGKKGGRPKKIPIALPSP